MEIPSQVYGIKLRNKASDKIMEYWFSKKELREEWLKRFSTENYEIVEYMNDQQELTF